MTTDPVCGMRVDENNPKATSQYQDKTYSFCSDECRRQFEKNPEQYAQRSAA
jgi:YHS domain-containing protein